ncbi:hypothetical protein Phpb_02539 [Photorhabdus namnaonensis]|uniref:Uncharacterized protein n=1 Tax=Photorhabdus namnaonensis TaxID=1851568 RepID=A0A1B8YG13_9GAMM|nr:hypothetical protein Phpb_02539 [Photorhabdus namnaonensis]
MIHQSYNTIHRSTKIDTTQTLNTRYKYRERESFSWFINPQIRIPNISQIEHSRPCSVQGLMLNVLGGQITYCHKDNKVTEYFLLKNGYVSNGLSRTQVI